MCSIRALWLIDEDGQVLLSRRFATVERRVRLRHRAAKAEQHLQYEKLAVPADTVVSRMFRDDFLSSYRHGDRADYPIMRLCSPSGGSPDLRECQHVLWPFLCLHENSTFLAVVPEVDQFLTTASEASTPKAVQLPSVTAAIALLRELASFTRPLRGNRSPDVLSEFQSQLCSVMPFGTPVQTSLAIVQEEHRAPLASAEAYPQKRPAWKPRVQTRSRQTVSLRLCETIHAMLYGRDDVVDAWQVNGTIDCDAQLSGVSEVTVPLTKTSGLQSLTVHSCALPPSNIVASELIFSPPLGKFTLARYNLDSDRAANPIVRGIYHMRCTAVDKIEIRLHLRWGTPLPSSSSVDDFSVSLPFPQFSSVDDLNLNCTSGAVRVRKFEGGVPGLSWRPGRNFRSSGSDAVLSGYCRVRVAAGSRRPTAQPLVAAPALTEGTCSGDQAPYTSGEQIGSTKHSSPAPDVPAALFGPSTTEPTLQAMYPPQVWSSWKGYSSDVSASPDVGRAASQGDPFFQGSNCFAQLHFSISNFTISGVDIDTDAVSIQPSAHLQIDCPKQLKSATYIIWNCLGASVSAARLDDITSPRTGVGESGSNGGKRGSKE